MESILEERKSDLSDSRWVAGVEVWRTEEIVWWKWWTMVEMDAGWWEVYEQGRLGMVRGAEVLDTVSLRCS